MLIRLCTDEDNEIVTDDDQALRIPSTQLRAVGSPFIVSTYSAPGRKGDALGERLEHVVGSGNSEINGANAYRLGKVNRSYRGAINGWHYEAPVQLYSIDPSWLDFRYIRQEDRIPTDVRAMHPAD